MQALAHSCKPAHAMLRLRDSRLLTEWAVCCTKQVVELRDPRCLVPAFEGLAPAEAAAALRVSQSNLLRLLHCAVSNPRGPSGDLAWQCMCLYCT